MPVIKPAKFHEPPPSHGLKPFATEHILVLNSAHLSPETLAVLAKDVAGHPADASIDGPVTVLKEVLEFSFGSNTRLGIDIRLTADAGTDLSKLPNDLWQCIAYAASYGFTGIRFEDAHPDDLPYCAVLRTYRDGD